MAAGSRRAPSPAKKAIQPDEREKLPDGWWRTRVNPTRILVTSTGIQTQADIEHCGLTKDAQAEPRSLDQLIDVARLRNLVAKVVDERIARDQTVGRLPGTGRWNLALDHGVEIRLLDAIAIRFARKEVADFPPDQFLVSVEQRE